MKKILLMASVLMMILSTAAGHVFTVNDFSAQEKTYAIGSRGPAGGWIFYDSGSSSGGWRYLEAAPEDQGRAVWGCKGKTIPGAQGAAIGDGRKNTASILKHCGDEDTAAVKVSAYRGGGKNDWFLPSIDELKAMYENLHMKAIGDFIDQCFWSSTEGGTDSAWAHDFYEGDRYRSERDRPSRVRAVRSF
ncbi:MAG: DUF1566 domain-containing protein [Spirochaetes bacterium]|nr:DUF1566 domain-containing protein [Spirochaetota bacterium]